MYTPVDPLSRFGAYVALFLVVSLILISAYDHRATRTAAAREPVLASTPHLIVVVATPTAAPTEIPAPAPTATPPPTPEPVVVVQYVEVPVVEYVPVEVLPATLAPPPAVVEQVPGMTTEQPPSGGRGGQSRFGGRPNLNPGPPDKAPDMPEAVAP